MDVRLDRASLDRFLAEVGAVADGDRKHETHGLELGGVSLVLRRDCHGVLRKIEARFPGDAGPRVRAAVRELAPWRSVGGAFEIADVPGLGSFFLLPDQLNVALRLEPERERVVRLVETLVGAPPSS